MLTFDHDETLAEARARNVRDALLEDIGRGDWTGRLVAAGERLRARVLVREAAVLCGRDWFDAVVFALDARSRVAWHAAEGAAMDADSLVCEVEGDARALLAAALEALRGLNDWSVPAIDAAVRALAEVHGLKLGKVAQPLRVALTGRTVSPGIFEVMVLIGKKESLARIGDHAA